MSMELEVDLNKMNESIDSCRYGSLGEGPQVHGCGIQNKLALNAEKIQKTKGQLVGTCLHEWPSTHQVS